MWDLADPQLTIIPSLRTYADSRQEMGFCEGYLLVGTQ